MHLLPLASLALLAAPLPGPGRATTHALAPAPAPCTTFCLAGREGPFFGRNYDWQVGVAHVTVNRRGLRKTAMVDSGQTPAEWTSRYGSLTFNQYGHEFPTGGMNEAGLVVELMLLEETRFPTPDERKELSVLQWVQYQLDNHGSVEQVLAADSEVRVSFGNTPIHFLVCDKDGEQATVEFLDGVMVAHTSADLPISALANSTYATSMRYLEGFEGFGGDRPRPTSQSSLDRFVRAACGVVGYEPSSAEETVEYAFGVLADVAQGDYTRWSIVYDIKDLTVHFRTREAPTIKTVKLSGFDLSNQGPARILPIDTPEAGDPTKRFVDYSTEANRKLIFQAYRETSFLARIPEAAMLEVARYPESIRAAVEAPEDGASSKQPRPDEGG